MPKKSIHCLPALLCLSLGAASPPVGIFEDHADVGTVLHAGSAVYDADKRTYTVSGSGENMWFADDAFQFAWKKISGDVVLTADVAFAGAGKEAHRKAVLMIRQSLDPDSAYADVARHGDGLTSLQARDEQGVNTSEIQSATAAPARLRIVRRGDYFYMALAGAGEEFRFAGGSLRVPMHDPVYVGIGVCSHNKDVLETAVFSNVSLTAAAVEAAQPVLYSTVETVPVSGDRRVVSVAPGRVTAPQLMPDGAIPEQSPVGKYVYRHSDRSGAFQIWRTLADGREPEQVTSDSLQNVFPCLSPDGQLLAFLSFAGGAPRIPEDQDVMLRVLSLKDNKIRVLAKLVGGKGTLDAPCWSPDSRRLSFVSYQMAPLTLLQGR